MTGPDSAGKEKKQRNGAPDYGLCLVVLILAGFGLVVLYSTSAWNGQVKFADPAYYLKKQLLATSLGLAVSEKMERGRHGGEGIRPLLPAHPE